MTHKADPTAPLVELRFIAHIVNGLGVYCGPTDSVKPLLVPNMTSPMMTPLIDGAPVATPVGAVELMTSPSKLAFMVTFQLYAPGTLPSMDLPTGLYGLPTELGLTTN